MFHVEPNGGIREVAEDLAPDLRRGLSELGQAASEEQIASLIELARMVESWGQRMNLTGHKTAAAVVRRLILDAAALLAAAPPFATLADLGSGAGFPGLPLAILRPELQLTLVEARERRHHFQRAARRALGLENVRALRGRIEELEATPHEAVLAQALAKPEQALAWMRPWASPAGWLLIPSTSDGPELPGAEGLASVELRTYQIPGGPRRRLWVGRLPG